MSHGREQDETRGTVGKRERVGGRKRSTPGMTDQDRAPDTELLKRLRDKFRLAFRRSVRRIRRPRTPSVAGTVDQNHAIRSCQRLAQRKPHVFHVSARTMDQHDGGLGTWRIPRKTHLGNMQTTLSTSTNGPAGGCEASIHAMPNRVTDPSTPSATTNAMVGAVSDMRFRPLRRNNCLHWTGFLIFQERRTPSVRFPT
jgi:hypothetical protein